MELASFLVILGLAAAFLGGVLDRLLIFFTGKRRESAVKQKLKLEQQIRDADKDVVKAQEDLDASAEEIRKRIIELRNRLNSNSRN